ncbi:MAG TPA: SDR family oxidoreductase, partial [Thermoleophilaceae bacterium]|nr:SDR family oxidoreductase [Thermoleophilaceae bacterium]
MNYFVTGATGFIGRHLLEALLERDGTIYALVREGSRGRLDDVRRRLGDEDRIVPVIGDISKRGLGVESLDEPIDHMFHLAAVYDMEADEETSRRANVDGTRSALAFANAHGVGLFHHVSSIAVAGRYEGLFREDMFDEGQKLDHPYFATKWEAERVVRAELKRPFRVYRPGIVVGHSETGQMDKIDGPYYFFGLIKKLRHALPEWFPLPGPEGGKSHLVPVDFVARAMDHIAHLPDAEVPGDTFHLVDPDPLTMGETVNVLAKAAGAPQLAMRVDANLTNIVPAPVRAGIGSLPTVKSIRRQTLADLGIPEQVLAHRDFRCDFDTRDAQRALRGSGIAVPPLRSYAGRLWDYWERNLDPDLFRERSLSRSVRDKRIVVTGASSGIGREVALKLGEAGAQVILVSRTREKLEEVAEQVAAAGGTAHVHPADLSDLEDIDRLAQEVLDQHGGV